MRVTCITIDVIVVLIVSLEGEAFEEVKFQIGRWLMVLKLTRIIATHIIAEHHLVSQFKLEYLPQSGIDGTLISLVKGLIQVTRIGDDIVGQSLAQTLQDRFNLSGLKSIKKGVVWEVKINSSRAKNMDELKKILEEKLLSKKTSDWVSEMEKDKIPCGPIFNIKEAVENPQIESRNMIVKAFHKVVGDFKLAGNPIKMSSYKDEKTRGDIPDLDEHRQKIIKEFCN